MSDSGLKFSNIKTNRNVFCSVFGCSSRACKDPEIRFHKFPKLDKSFVEIRTRNGNKEMIDRRRLWKRVLKMGKEVTPNMVFCSKYFKREDYMLALYFYVCTYINLLK